MRVHSPGRRRRGGGTVDFLNSDRLLHNIHSVPKLNATFNRTQPKGRTIPITFAKPEIVRINCDLHSWMRGWVVVAAHPFYAVTGADGQFALRQPAAGPVQAADLARAPGHVPASVTVGAHGGDRRDDDRAASRARARR